MVTVALVTLLVSKLDVTFAPDGLTRTEYSLALTSKGHKWLFETRVLKDFKASGKFIDRFVRATCDGKLVWREQVGLDAPKHLPVGNFIKFSKPKVKAPWPIVAMRGHNGLGFWWDTCFYSVDGTKLGPLGHPPALNSNGPINYKGRQHEWLFDTYNIYEQEIHTNERHDLYHVLYRLDGPTRLRKVRSWRSKTPLRDTVGLSEW